jgi:hypothetical protein
MMSEASASTSAARGSILRITVGRDAHVAENHATKLVFEVLMLLRALSLGHCERCDSNAAIKCDTKRFVHAGTGKHRSHSESKIGRKALHIV